MLASGTEGQDEAASKGGTEITDEMLARAAAGMGMGGSSGAGDAGSCIYLTHHSSTPPSHHLAYFL